MSKKMKLLLAGGIAGAILLIGVVILTLWLAVWMPPSKDDFVKAKKDAEKIVEYSGLTQMNDFAKAMNVKYREGKTGQELVDATKAERQKTLEAIDNRAKLAEQLRGSRVLRDAEVKKSFDVYAPIEVTFDAYVRNYTNEYPKYLTSVVSCSKPFNLGAKATTLKEAAKAHGEYGKVCLEDLAKLEKSPLPPYVKYAKEFKDVINERQKVLDGAANGTITAQAATPRITASNGKYRTIWPNDALKEYRKTQMFNGELKKLIEVLDKKAK